MKKYGIDSLRLDNAFLVEANPDRSNIFYESKLRPSSGEDKLDAVLAPLADELMEKKLKCHLQLFMVPLQLAQMPFYFLVSI